MPLSNAGQNATKTYGERRFPFNPTSQPAQSGMGQFSTNQNQPQTQPGASYGAADTQKPKLMQVLQPEPTRDIQGEDNIKRRAKINALGRLFGSLGQLGGMASGGDAVRLEDNSTPWLKNQSMVMDNDFRNQLNQYYNRLFQTDMSNNQLENQWAMRDQDRGFQKELRADDQNFRREERAEDKDFRREERNEAQDFQTQMQDRQFAQQMKQLGVRNQQDFDKMMMGVGVNPRDPNAMKQFLDKMAQQYDNQNDYTQAKANWNNRLSTSGNKTGATDYNINDPEFQSAFRRGRDLQLTRLRNQYNKLISSQPEFGEDTKLRDKDLEFVISQIKQLETLKPEVNNPLVFDLYEEGLNLGPEGVDKSIGPPREEQAIPGISTGAQQGTNRPSSLPKFNPDITPEQRQQSINTTIDTVRANKSKILSENPDWQLIGRLIEQSMANGLFDNEEEAFNSIIELAENL
jgi:hypothetical protein